MMRLTDIIRNDLRGVDGEYELGNKRPILRPASLIQVVLILQSQRLSKMRHCFIELYFCKKNTS